MLAWALGLLVLFPVVGIGTVAAAIALVGFIISLYVFPAFANSNAAIVVLVVRLILFAVIAIGLQLYAAIRGILVVSRGEVLTLPSPRLLTLTENAGS